MAEERPGGLAGFRRLGQRHLERLSQPGNGPRRTPPGAKELGGVADRLVLAAEADVRRRRRRHALIADQVIGNIPIGVGRRPQQAAGNGRVALAAKGQQGGRVGPFGRTVVLVTLQQALGFLVAVQIHQGAQEQVAHALVVVGIQPQHFRIMLDRLGPLARLPQALGQPQPGPHVGARPLIEPEVARHGLESLRADRPLAGGHAFLQELPGLVAGGGLVGQDHVGVGAIGRHAQGLPRQFRLFLRPRGLPGQIGNFLGDGQGAARFSAAGSELPQKSFQGTRRRGGKALRLRRPPRPWGCRPFSPSFFSWPRYCPSCRGRLGVPSRVCKNCNLCRTWRTVLCRERPPRRSVLPNMANSTCRERPPRRSVRCRRDFSPPLTVAGTMISCVISPRSTHPPNTPSMGGSCPNLPATNLHRTFVHCPPDMVDSLSSP